MLLENMRPMQVKDTVARSVPLLWPIGDLEMHGYHLPINTDLLFVYEISKMVGERREVVVAPPIYYSITGLWASGQDMGTLDIDREAYRLYVKSVLENLVLMGFKKIFILNHHQSLDGPNMLLLRHEVNDLVWRMAAVKRGKGWGAKDALGPKEGVDYPLIRFVQVSGLAGVKPPGNHSGIGETCFVLYVRPELVDMEELKRPDQPDYSFREGCEATKATPEMGREYVESMVSALIEYIEDVERSLAQ